MIPIVLNSQSVSGITGSISIACWIIVFVPQIYENFYRSSAEGLSLLFVVLWLLGDIFNFFGAVLQGLLPTMIILAGYYTIADVILLAQCLFYGGEEQVDPVHLSPANPMNDRVLEDVFHERQPLLNKKHHDHATINPADSAGASSSSTIAQLDAEAEVADSPMKNYIINTLLICGVFLGGFLSWYISYLKDPNPITIEPDLHMNWMAQFFGYLSAVLYLSSRVPQILLNFQRKSCEGISFLFFLFACIGNITFIISVLSISLEYRYLLVNASWLIGSSGTLLMDFVIFLQFFAYRTDTVQTTGVSV
ncbi:LANO_0A05578g1_1 [Lachancea nothofagi CBS 11611]|uniref:LANO_0A05578g1_1 n=1 Tax=Lachancea nothofagi CBS 11611 TaxID=1266666 RepID=A0A1G4IR59_9SACH|nr:LANO_0A05578g1_1 [Lachancea nothofagi CBS 11611]